jgi:hypothetical protein
LLDLAKVHVQGQILWLAFPLALREAALLGTSPTGGGAAQALAASTPIG